MRKIAVVIPKYGLVGGAEQFAAELTGRLARQTGYDFHVYANRWQQSAVNLSYHRVPIISFPKFLTTLSFAYFANRLISANNVSLVHSHERIFTADIVNLHGIPHRYWIANVRKKRMNLHDRATDWVERKLVSEGRCRKFIAVSSLTKDIFLRECSIEPNKIAVIHPGVDIREYERHNQEMARAGIRRELGISPSEPVLLFASMNYEIKGLDAVLFALAKLKTKKENFKLVVAGRGNIKKYEKIAREAEIADSVIFTGEVKKEKLIQLYLAGDLYIMLSKFDTFGMVVLEAMAAGLPAIISDKVGAKDLVNEGKNGFIIKKPSDSGDVAAKIALLLNENTRRQMAEAARETAESNTWDMVAAKYQEIYKDILSLREER